MTNNGDGGILGSRGFNSAGLCVDFFSKLHRQHIRSVAIVTKSQYSFKGGTWA